MTCDGAAAVATAGGGRWAANCSLLDYFSTPPTWSTCNAASKVLQAQQLDPSSQNAAQCPPGQHAHHLLGGDHQVQHPAQPSMSAILRIHHPRGPHVRTDHPRPHPDRRRARVPRPRARRRQPSRGRLPPSTWQWATASCLPPTGYGVLSRAALRELLAGGGADLEACARRIVDAAAQAGSDDNLTALIVSIDQLPLETLDETHRPHPTADSAGARQRQTASTASGKCWT